MSERKSIRVRRQPERLNIGEQKEEKKIISKKEKAKEAYGLIIHMREDAYLHIIPVSKLSHEMKQILDNKKEYLSDKEMEVVDNQISIALIRRDTYKTLDTEKVYNVTRYYFKKYEEE